jgi:class 3 adenylate cyclase/tetratricopeptide (TPR) repeat protein
LIIPSEPSQKIFTTDEKLEKIQKYLPKGLAKKILSQRDRIEGERKQVTVMFCDMEGFTQLSERLGPEEAYTIMDQVYEILIHKVHDYEGTVNEFTGDGIMALFGAPIALEDAPQRAIRSAYAIHREMSRFNDKIKQEKQNIPPIKMRIGIHTGPVVVGTLGNDLRVEFKAVGDTVNLASRMEGLAVPGSTYVSEDTFKLTEGLFRFEALGEYAVKGKADTVKAYRVIAPSTSRTRFDVSAERGLTPFVGRGRELEILLDAFERAKTGRGQAISLMSEAGVGKSRLLYEFRKAVSNEDVTFQEGKCLSYSRGVTYHPVIDIVKSNFDIKEGDGDLEIKEKLQRGLKILGEDEASTLPYLLELLSVKDSGIDKIMISPEGKRDRIIETLKKIVLKGSEIRPLIMAIEDLHWVDKSSEDVFKYLLESIPGAAVFLIFTYRPEFVHTWGAKSFHNQLTLNRLSNRESLAMVTYLLATEDFDRNLEELILEKAEGVPFFIEEFIRSLKDLKIIEREDNKYNIAKGIEMVTIPSTIQDVIMARVDNLPEASKKLLQTGSGIEREFSYQLIKRITDLQEQELLSQLSILKDSELLYERGIYPGSTYIFKHALTQEVVYDSILTRRKKKLHEEIANAIEELYKENIVEHYGVLSEHYVKSENYEKGADYSKLASRKAGKTAAMNDAISYTQKRITCLEKLVETDEVQKNIIDARTNLGLYYNQMNYFVNSKEAVEPIIEQALKRGYQNRLSQIYTILGTYYWTIEEKFSEAFNYLEQALKIAEKIRDVLSLTTASFWLGAALAFDCEFDKAKPYNQKALDLSVAANVPWIIAAHKAMIGYFIHHHQGRVSLGHQITNEAVRIAEEGVDAWSMGISYMCHGAACYGKGLLEEATKSLTKASNYSERINLNNWASFAHHFLGKTYFEVGEYPKSQDHFDKAAKVLEPISIIPAFTSLSKIGVARAKVMRNEKDIELRSLCEHAAKNQISLFDGRMSKYIAEILLNIDDQHAFEAEDWVRKAIEADKRNGMMFYLGRDHALYADLLKRKGDQSKAKENLNKAVDILKECGADGWVEKYEKELAAL